MEMSVGAKHGNRVAALIQQLVADRQKVVGAYSDHLLLRIA